MQVTPIRIPSGLLKGTQSLIDKGFYSNKSEVVRDALRKLLLEYQIGSIPKGNNSVKEVKDARKILSKNVYSFKDLNKI